MDVWPKCGIKQYGLDPLNKLHPVRLNDKTALKLACVQRIA